jgi:hypothetical protein
LMIIATTVATLVAIWSLWWKIGLGWSIIVIVAFVGLILVVHFMRKAKDQTAAV